MKRSLTPVLLTLLTCMVACLSYFGAITIGGVLSLVLPSALVVALVGAKVSRMTLPGLVLVGALAFIVGQVVNLLSGEFQGPAARGAFLAAAASGAAMVLSASRAPALMLIPVGGIVVGALTLGAGGQVQIVAVVTAALALLSLSAIERERRAMTVPQRSTVQLVLVLVLVGAAGVFAALFQGQYDSREPAAPLRTTINESVQPPSLLRLPNKATDEADTSGLPVVGEDIAPADIVQDPPFENDSKTSPLWWLALLVPALLLLLVLLRVFLASWSWRRYFRRLRREGDVRAAWTWTLAHLTRVGLAPPPHDSPDRIAGGHLEGLYEPLHEPVRELAAAVAPVVYGPAVGTDERATWLLAERAARQAWSCAGTGRRCQARWRWAPAKSAVGG